MKKMLSIFGSICVTAAGSASVMAFTTPETNESKIDNANDEWEPNNSESNEGPIINGGIPADPVIKGSAMHPISSDAPVKDNKNVLKDILNNINSKISALNDFIDYLKNDPQFMSIVWPQIKHQIDNLKQLANSIKKALADLGFNFEVNLNNFIK